MGKGSQTSTQDTSSNFNQSTSYDIPSNVRNAWNNALGMAGNVANIGFQGYQGVPVAPFSPDTLTGHQRLRNIANDPTLQNLGNQLLSSSSTLTQNGGLPTQEQLNPLMNMYTQNVTDIGLENLQEQYDVMRQQLYGNQALAGSFGGARHGVQEGELQRGMLRNMAELAYGGAQDSFNYATDSFFRGQGQQANNINSMWNIGQGMRDTQVANANNLYNIGQDYQGNAQRALDFGVGEFGRGVQFPYDNANFFSNIAYGYPQVFDSTTSGTSNSTTTQTTPGPSLFDQILGGGLAAAGLFGGGGPLAGVASSLFGAIGGGGGGGSSGGSSGGYWSNPAYGGYGYNPPPRIGSKDGGGIPEYYDGGGVRYDMTPGYRNNDRGFFRGDDELNISYTDGAYTFGDPRVQELWDIQQAGRHGDPQAWHTSRRDRGQYENLFQNLQLMQLANQAAATGGAPIPTDAGGGAQGPGNPADPNADIAPWVQQLFGGDQGVADWFLQTFGGANPGGFGLPSAHFAHNTDQGTVGYNQYINDLYGMSPDAALWYPEVYGPGGFNELQSAQGGPFSLPYTRAPFNYNAGSGMTVGDPIDGGAGNREARRQRRQERQAARGLNVGNRFGRMPTNNVALEDGGRVPDWLQNIFFPVTERMENEQESYQDSFGEALDADHARILELLAAMEAEEEGYPEYPLPEGVSPPINYNNGGAVQLVQTPSGAHHPSSASNTGFWSPDATSLGLQRDNTQYAMTRGNRGMPVGYGYGPAWNRQQGLDRGRMGMLGRAGLARAQGSALEAQQNAMPDYGGMTPQEHTDMLRAADPNWNQDPAAVTTPGGPQIQQPIEGYQPVGGGTTGGQQAGWQGFNGAFNQNFGGGGQNGFLQWLGRGQGGNFGGGPSRFANGGPVKYEDGSGVEGGPSEEPVYIMSDYSAIDRETNEGRGGPGFFGNIGNYLSNLRGPTKAEREAEMYAQGMTSGEIASRNLSDLAGNVLRGNPITAPGAIAMDWLGSGQGQDVINPRVPFYGDYRMSDLWGGRAEADRMRRQAEAANAPEEPTAEEAPARRDTPAFDALPDFLVNDEAFQNFIAGDDLLPLAEDIMQGGDSPEVSQAREEVDEASKRRDDALNWLLIEMGMNIAGGDYPGAGDAVRGYRQNQSEQARYNAEWEQSMREYADRQAQQQLQNQQWNQSFGLQQQELALRERDLAARRAAATQEQVAENNEYRRDLWTDALNNDNIGAFMDYLMHDPSIPNNARRGMILQYLDRAGISREIYPEGTSAEQFAANLQDALARGAMRDYE